MSQRNLAQLHEGMDVRGADTAPIGVVKEVHVASFVIGRTLQPEVTVPFDVIGSVMDENVDLTITADQIDEMFWAHAGEGIKVDLRGEYD